MSIEKFDWRMDLITELVEDLPAAFPGGPSWPAGTPFYASIIVKRQNGENVSFAAPSVVAMYLNLAINAAKKASELRLEIEYSSTVSVQNGMRNIVSIEKLFDMFEQVISCISASFTALEAYCNYMISRIWCKDVEVRRHGKPVKYSHVEAERNISTEDKLKTILPKIFAIPTPAGKAVWNDFVSLKKARDEITHFKYADQYPVGLREVEDPLFRRLLDVDPFIYPEAARKMLNYFNTDPAARPRWLEKMPLIEVKKA